ncbi:hypothetical protein O9992_06205 [Vibrio lentus]|nr:hypothetical protein [Vibrio lentus]
MKRVSSVLIGNATIKVDTNTEFCGYTGTEGAGEISALFVDGEEVSSPSAGDKSNHP